MSPWKKVIYKKSRATECNTLLIARAKTAERKFHRPVTKIIYGKKSSTRLQYSCYHKGKTVERKKVALFYIGGLNFNTDNS